MTLEKIQKMDVRSEEFFEIYKAVNEKYWTFEDPDDEQKARHLLHLITDRGDPEDVVLLVEIFKQLGMLKEEGGATSCELQFGGQTFFFRVATSRDQMDSLHKALTNAVLVKSREENQQ